MKLKTKKLLLSSAILASLSVATVSHAADVTVTDGTPAVVFDDTSTAADGNEWVVRGRDEFFGVYDEINNYYSLIFFPGTNTSRGLERSSGGDVFLAGASVFIDESENRVGIGTTGPANDLHIRSSDPTIRLDDTDGVAWELNRDGNSGFFDIANATSGTSILGMYSSAPANSLVLHPDGVGIGTNTPSASLHVRQSGADLIVQDTNATAGIRNLVNLRNNGGVGFRLTDTQINNEWEFRSGGGGTFVVANTGVDGGNMLLTTAGGVLMGLNAGVSTSSNFNLQPSGNLSIPNGSVTAVSHISSSSRAVKKDFAQIDAKDIMTKIQGMEVTEWRYKDESAKGRHIGPMAEDFYSLFGLGPDDKHVAATDMASIAIIAAKELQKAAAIVKSETTSLKSETIALKNEAIEMKAENALLKARLAALEKLVTNLASGQGLLPKNGEQVVLNKQQ